VFTHSLSLSLFSLSSLSPGGTSCHYTLWGEVGQTPARIVRGVRQCGMSDACATTMCTETKRVRFNMVDGGGGILRCEGAAGVVGGGKAVKQ
jgi:hypothetical protein